METNTKQLFKCIGSNSLISKYHTYQHREYPEKVVSEGYCGWVRPRTTIGYLQEIMREPKSSIKCEKGGTVQGRSLNDVGGGPHYQSGDTHQINEKFFCDEETSLVVGNLTPQKNLNLSLFEHLYQSCVALRERGKTWHKEMGRCIPHKSEMTSGDGIVGEDRKVIPIAKVIPKTSLVEAKSHSVKFCENKFLRRVGPEAVRLLADYNLKQLNSSFLGSYFDNLEVVTNNEVQFIGTSAIPQFVCKQFREYGIERLPYSSCA